jgi:hypothetical protein
MNDLPALPNDCTWHLAGNCPACGSPIFAKISATKEIEIKHGCDCREKLAETADLLQALQGDDGEL